MTPVITNKQNPDKVPNPNIMVDIINKQYPDKVPNPSIITDIKSKQYPDTVPKPSIIMDIISKHKPIITDNINKQYPDIVPKTNKIIIKIRTKIMILFIMNTNLSIFSSMIKAIVSKILSNINIP